jgi:hypothetical protein
MRGWAGGLRFARCRSGALERGDRLPNEGYGLLIPVSLDADPQCSSGIPAQRPGVVGKAGGRSRGSRCFLAAKGLAAIVAGATSVHACEGTASQGYYLLMVPPSTARPHAVRHDRNLRYPRRDGTTTRWLAEAGVADAYRNRFSIARNQSDRLAQVMAEGVEAMDLSDGAFTAVAVVPTGAGAMSIDLARMAMVQHWVREHGPANFMDGFSDLTSTPTSAVRAHRVTVAPYGSASARATSIWSSTTRAPASHATG